MAGTRQPAGGSGWERGSLQVGVAGSEAACKWEWLGARQPAGGSG